MTIEEEAHKFETITAKELEDLEAEIRELRAKLINFSTNDED